MGLNASRPNISNLKGAVLTRALAHVSPPELQGLRP